MQLHLLAEYERGDAAKPGQEGTSCTKETACAETQEERSSRSVQPTGERNRGLDGSSLVLPRIAPTLAALISSKLLDGPSVAFPEVTNKD